MTSRWTSTRWSWAMAELSKLMPCQRNKSRIVPDDRGPGRLEQTYSKSEERLEATEQVVKQDKQNKHPAYQVHGVPGYEMKVLFIIFCLPVSTV
jgi:hypothetical protein